MNKLDFSLFGTFIVKKDDEIVDLEQRLGKQLSSILAMLLLSQGKSVSKEKLYETFWSDSENPASACKYAIFRLRQELNKIEIFEENELIVTSKSGYMINIDLDFEVDSLTMERYITEAKANHDLGLYELSLDLYANRFLNNLDSDWVLAMRTYYERLFITVSIIVANEYYRLGKYQIVYNICDKVLSYSQYNEEILYIYFKSMISNKEYNRAMTYYDKIGHRYFDEFHIPLPDNISALFNGTKMYEKKSRIDKETIESYLNINPQEDGPLGCDYLSFRNIYKIESRNSKRNNKKIILIVFELKTDIENLKYLAILEQVLKNTLRVNDVYTKSSDKQMMVLVEISKENDEYTVIKRIQNQFYKKVDSKVCRLNYSSMLDKK